jgi:hypothetical protein
MCVCQTVYPSPQSHTPNTQPHACVCAHTHTSYETEEGGQKRERGTWGAEALCAEYLTVLDEHGAVLVWVFCMSLAVKTEHCEAAWATERMRERERERECEREREKERERMRERERERERAREREREERGGRERELSRPSIVEQHGRLCVCECVRVCACACVCLCDVETEQFKAAWAAVYVCVCACVCVHVCVYVCV